MNKMKRKKFNPGESVAPGTYLTAIRDGKVDVIARADSAVTYCLKKHQRMKRYEGVIRTLHSVPGDRKSSPEFVPYWEMLYGTLCESSRDDLELLKKYLETELERVNQKLKGA